MARNSYFRGSAPNQADLVFQQALERTLEGIGSLAWRHRLKLLTIAAAYAAVAFGTLGLIVGGVILAALIFTHVSPQLLSRRGRTGRAQTGTSSLWDPIHLGADADGDPVEITLVERNLLIGGIPGAGKSAAISLILAVASGDPNVHITGIDGKQVELWPWRDCLENLAVEPEEAVQVLARMQALMKTRFEHLAEHGLKKVTRDIPLQLVVIDELAEFTVGIAKQARDEFNARLRSIVSRGRAAGIVVVAATQKPSADVVPTYIRDLFAYRWALSCTTPEASDTILGHGYASRGFDASAMGPLVPGTGWLLAEGGSPVKFRSDYLDDGQIVGLVARAQRAQA